MRGSFTGLFETTRPILGMVHVPALPGTPRHSLSVDQIVRHSIEDGLALKRGGVHGILIENMHDVPYLKRVVGHEITAIMSIIAREMHLQTGLPCGVQVLSGANESALSVALAGGLDFIRSEGFVYGHLADEGYIDSDAGTLLRKRKALGADHIFILTDVKKKHASHAITGDMDVLETARGAAFFGSDGLIVTGLRTGHPPDPDLLQSLKGQVDLPVIIGSGISSQNIHRYYDLADAFIVGSWFKKQGHWERRVEEDRVRLFMTKVAEIHS